MKVNSSQKKNWASKNDFLLKAFLIAFLAFSPGMLCATPVEPQLKKKISAHIERLMTEGDIPGISVVLISQGETTYFTHGYADIEDGKKVGTKTLFQLGSCSKAFTALAAVHLAQQGKINMTDYVSTYIPWFEIWHENRKVQIRLIELLHHTSGIPWNTISKIPETNADDALVKTVQTLIGLELDELPGKRFEYATINYDVLALVIEKVTGKRFEDYVYENVLTPLRLSSTTIGVPVDSSLMASGYKIGFFGPRYYNAPVFRGNNAAGYFISNAEDMARWIQFQMGLVNSDLYAIAGYTHQRDETVPLHGMSAYAKGWEISLSGNGQIYHEGLNPNFTAYVAMRPGTKMAVVVLANSNSNFTKFIAEDTMKLLSGEELDPDYRSESKVDKVFSIITIIVALYILVVCFLTGNAIVDVIRQKRKYEGKSVAIWCNLGYVLVILFPFLLGIYWIPEAMGGFTWKSIFVWTPVSCPVALLLIIAAVVISYGSYALTLCFPQPNKLRAITPRLLLLSILSGLSNMVLIVLITSSIGADTNVKYLMFYYLLTAAVYLFGRRYVQINLVRYSRQITYELRVNLVNKIFSTSYDRFEKMDRGRIYTTLNDDVSTIGDSANTFIMLVTSLITAIGAFLYLATIAFWSTALTLFLVCLIATLYYFVSRSTNHYFNAARDTRNVFMRLTNGMIDGFKELSLHRRKTFEYKEDILNSAWEFKKKISIAGIRFLNAFLVGEALLIALLAVTVFAIPELFPGMHIQVILSFVLVLLYLIGPINGILTSIPVVAQFRIAWNRIHDFLKEIPANLDLDQKPEMLGEQIEKFAVSGIKFTYKASNDQTNFVVGPVDFELRRGEILFIIGGNGSGKTTLGKLLVGLYESDEGNFLINGSVTTAAVLREYFSVVFTPPYLFEKLYNIRLDGRHDEVAAYLNSLDLSGKVKIEKEKYSTINLSAGQRKRLALLQCYLEDSPIYLFDEWAADQDPGYRQFFYRTMLPEMKARGKIVIVITHDDQYFDVADKVLKLNMGMVETDGHKNLLSAVHALPY